MNSFSVTKVQYRSHILIHYNPAIFIKYVVAPDLIQVAGVSLFIVIPCSQTDSEIVELDGKNLIANLSKFENVEYIVVSSNESI